MTTSNQTWTPTDAELALALKEIGGGAEEISKYIEELGAQEPEATRKCTRKATGTSCYCNGEPTGEIWEVTCIDADGKTNTFTHCKCK